MVYHRHRLSPCRMHLQREASPGVGNNLVTIDLPGPALDPEADADHVYQLLIEAIGVV